MSSSAPGRNDSCPCGSGRKYKHCHLASAEGELRALSRLRDIEASVFRQLMGWTVNSFGEGLFVDGWLDFEPWSDKKNDDPQDDPEYYGLFVPWFLTCWRPAPDQLYGSTTLPDRPVAELFLAASDASLAGDERLFLERVLAAPFSFHKTVGFPRLLHAAVRDLLSGAEADLMLGSWDSDLEEGDILYGRVVRADGMSIVSGGAPWTFTPAAEGEIVAWKQAQEADGPPLSEAALVADPTRVHQLYRQITAPIDEAEASPDN